jgi:RsiW-degrading membrane proteinase PrsW (M82 family)
MYLQGKEREVFRMSLLFFILMIVCFFATLFFQQIAMWLVAVSAMLGCIFGFLMIIFCKK